MPSRPNGLLGGGITLTLLILVSATVLSGPGCRTGRTHPPMTQTPHGAAPPENRLARETSPYLRQHARNPVDWYPWGEEALERARREKRPIFLSIGYSACHWCHVMERESFEDPETARLMNEHFVNIKVDREERPDLDEIYMTATQALTGRGGWPMSVWLTPDLKPFYAGTYFPPTERYGMPSFRTVLRELASHYESQPERVATAAQELAAHVGQLTRIASPPGLLTEELLREAAATLITEVDRVHGGFGGAPKFPHPMALALLIHHHVRTRSCDALEAIELTLGKMAEGGIYDHLGGGFHRYSVDEHWGVPHFEKMLYDNALLGSVYLEAWQVTGKESYRRVARETLDWLIREMQEPAGGFASTQDADSEGVEGKFFAWDPSEVRAGLGEEDGRLFCETYGVTPTGNFEHGKSVLHVARPIDEAARPRLDALRRRLLEARERRVKPGRDDKVLASWNGLAISTLARAGAALDEPRYVEAARRAADFVTREMTADGRLLRVHRAGTSRVPALQDDYAHLGLGLLDLYEAGFDERWFRAARDLARTMVELFHDPEEGGFFYTEAGRSDLIVRTKNPYDNAVPSGNSIGALLLLRLATMLGDQDLAEKAAGTLRAFRLAMERAPSGFGQMLIALDWRVGPVQEVALVGRRDDAATRALVRAVRRSFQPNRVVALLEPGAASDLPLLQGKTLVDGKPAFYLCRNFTCEKPLTDPEAVAAALSR